jgi:uncharacterized protein YbaR (Trm112 family)
MNDLAESPVLNQVRERTINCPNCRGHCSAEENAELEALIDCRSCMKNFPLAEALPLLERAEILLMSMIIGLFVFVFRRMPAWVYGIVVGWLRNIREFCRWLLPFSWRAVRVAVLLFVCLEILIGPACVLTLGAVWTKGWPGYWSLLLGVLAGLWLLGVSVGYGWAFFYYRRSLKPDAFRFPWSALRPRKIVEKCRALVRLVRPDGRA